MKRVCVIGWPIKHSRSPLIHNHWIEQFGIDAHYDLAAVPPEGLETFLKTMREVGLAGCNVTVPHKEAVFGLVTVDDEFTRRLGAVNTVYLKDGVLHGTQHRRHRVSSEPEDRQPRMGCRARPGNRTRCRRCGACRAGHAE